MADSDGNTSGEQSEEQGGKDRRMVSCEILCKMLSRALILAVWNFSAPISEG